MYSKFRDLTGQLDIRLAVKPYRTSTSSSQRRNYNVVATQSMGHTQMDKSKSLVVTQLPRYLSLRMVLWGFNKVLRKSVSFRRIDFRRVAQVARWITRSNKTSQIRYHTCSISSRLISSNFNWRSTRDLIQIWNWKVTNMTWCCNQLKSCASTA